MSRKHLFAIVVLLGAAAVAGLLALTRTTAAATQASSTQITAKSRSLDQLEASLRRSLAEQPPVVDPTRPRPAAVPRTVFVPSSTARTATGEREGEHGDDDHGYKQAHEDEGADD